MRMFLEEIKKWALATNEKKNTSKHNRTLHIDVETAPGLCEHVFVISHHLFLFFLFFHSFYIEAKNTHKLI